MTQSMEAITSQFAEQQNKNEIVEILKELFDKNKLHMITDLEPDEVRLITRILIIAKLKNLDSWETGVELFMTLMLSKGRRSRWEIIEGVKGYNTRVSGLSRFIPERWRGGGGR